MYRTYLSKKQKKTRCIQLVLGHQVKVQLSRISRELASHHRLEACINSNRNLKKESFRSVTLSFLNKSVILLTPFKSSTIHLSSKHLSSFHCYNSFHICLANSLTAPGHLWHDPVNP